MEKPEFLETAEEHQQKEWLKMRIEFDQANSRVSILQGENQRLRTKYNQIADSLKDVTQGYEDKIKEYTQQIKKQEADITSQTTDVLQLQQDIID